MKKCLSSLIYFGLIFGFSFQSLAGVTSSSNNLKINRIEEPVGRAILFSEKGEFIKHFIQFGYSTHIARVRAFRICEWEKNVALKEYCKIDMDFL